MIRWPKKRFFDGRCLEICFLGRFLKKVVPSTKNPWKKSSQSIGHQRIQPTEKLSQKAKQSPSKNRFKFQNNNPKTGRRALARRPVFGRRRLRRRVVVLKCVSIFCRTWLGFLAKPFSAGIWPPDFWPRFLDRLCEDFSKHFPNTSKK